MNPSYRQTPTLVGDKGILLAEPEKVTIATAGCLASVEVRGRESGLLHAIVDAYGYRAFTTPRVVSCDATGAVCAEQEFPDFDVLGATLLAMVTALEKAPGRAVKRIDGGAVVWSERDVEKARKIAAVLKEALELAYSPN